MGLVLLGAVLLVAIGFTLWAFIDAQLQPAYSWADTGISQGVTTVVLVFTCGIGALYYFGFVRPRLVRSRDRGTRG